MVNVSAVTNKMITFSEGNLHDINHFMKVYAFARTIGINEELDPEQQEILEISALVHDIACPLCRQKYGNTNGSYQELEGGPLATALLSELALPQKLIERVSYLVAHHHTYTNVDGMDYQILLEADFLVNADESNMAGDAIKAAKDSIFHTKTGKKLLQDIYLRTDRMK